MCDPPMRLSPDTGLPRRPVGGQCRPRLVRRRRCGPSSQVRIESFAVKLCTELCTCPPLQPGWLWERKTTAWLVGTGQTLSKLGMTERCWGGGGWDPLFPTPPTPDPHHNRVRPCRRAVVQRQAAEIARLRQAGAGPSAPAAVFAPRLRAAAAATADATGLGQALATGQRLLTGVPPTVVGGSNSRGVRTIFLFAAFLCVPRAYLPV